jgi:hypothetical protein
MLPKIDKPLFEVNIPSLERNVLFRPFTVKEEKILLTAQQQAEDKSILLAIKQVVNNCCQDAAINVNELATFDLEYVFLKLRARSVNNIIEVSYRDAEDDKVYDFEVDLDEVKLIKDETINRVIEVAESTGVKMKYPAAHIIDNAPTGSASELVEYLIANCVDCIYDADTIYPASDYKLEELLEWLDNLDIESFKKITEFFDKLPQLYYRIEYRNSLGNDRTIELTKLSDFFIWR